MPRITMPRIGYVKDGWQYFGGDPARKESWRPLPGTRDGDYEFIGTDPMQAGDKRAWRKVSGEGTGFIPEMGAAGRNIYRQWAKAAGGVGQALGEWDPQADAESAARAFQGAAEYSGVGDQILMGANALAQGAMAAFADQLPSPPPAVQPWLAENGADLVDRANRSMEDIPGEGISRFMAQAFQGVGGTMLPSMATLALTRNPGLAASFIGPYVYGQEYGDERAAGASPMDARGSAALQTAAEYIPERMALGSIQNGAGSFLPKAVNRYTPTQLMAQAPQTTFGVAGRAMVGEGAQETATQAMQDALSDPDMPLGERIVNMAHAAALGAVGGGMSAVPTAPFIAAKNRAESAGDGGRQPPSPGSRDTAVDAVRRALGVEPGDGVASAAPGATPPTDHGTAWMDPYNPTPRSVPFKEELVATEPAAPPLENWAPLPGQPGYLESIEAELWGTEAARLQEEREMAALERRTMPPASNIQVEEVQPEAVTTAVPPDQMPSRPARNIDVQELEAEDPNLETEDLGDPENVELAPPPQMTDAMEAGAELQDELAARRAQRAAEPPAKAAAPKGLAVDEEIDYDNVLPPYEEGGIQVDEQPVPRGTNMSVKPGDQPAASMSRREGAAPIENMSSRTRTIQEHLDATGQKLRGGRGQQFIVTDTPEQWGIPGVDGTERGAYYRGKVYLATGNMSNAADIQETILHETSHGHLKEFMGEEWGVVMDEVYKAITQGHLNRANEQERVQHQATLRQIAKSNGFDLTNPADQRRAAEEFLARLSETMPQSTVLTRALHRIMEFLRRNLGAYAPQAIQRLKRSDLIEMIAASRQQFQTGQQQESLTLERLRKGRQEMQAQQQRDAEAARYRKGEEPRPLTYSKIFQAVANEPMKKGNADQWLNRFTKAGIKREEVEWYGLDVWLKERGVVTKEELTDFLVAQGEPEIEVVDAKPNLSLSDYANESVVGTSHDMYQEPGAIPGSYREQIIRWKGGQLDDLDPLHFGVAREDDPTSTRGVIATIRYNDRFVGAETGRLRKVRYIEEVQSDPHQKGSEIGYQPRGADLNPNDMRPETVPGKDSWQRIAAAQIFRQAVKDGVDSVVFTSGAQQARRWGGIVTVNSFTPTRNEKGGYDLNAQWTEQRKNESGDWETLSMEERVPMTDEQLDSKLRQKNADKVRRIANGERANGEEELDDTQRLLADHIDLHYDTDVPFKFGGMSIEPNATEWRFADTDGVVVTFINGTQSKTMLNPERALDFVWRAVLMDEPNFSPRPYEQALSRSKEQLYDQQQTKANERFLREAGVPKEEARGRLVDDVIPKGNDGRGYVNMRDDVNREYDITDSIREAINNPTPLFLRRGKSDDTKTHGATFWSESIGTPFWENVVAPFTDKVLTAIAKPLDGAFDFRPVKGRIKQILRRARAEMTVKAHAVKEIGQALQHFTDAELSLMSDYIEGELEAGVIPPKHVVEMAALIVEANRRNADELQALGMLSEESRKLWGDRYLPRYYAKHIIANPFDRMLMQAMRRLDGSRLKGRGLTESVRKKDIADYEREGWQVRWTKPDALEKLEDDDKVMMWRDFTKSERQRMKEIRNAGYRFLRGHIEVSKDIAMGKAFKALVDEGIAVDEALEGYVQVPDNAISKTGGLKTYGAAAGKWVPTEVWHQMKASRGDHGALMRAHLKMLSLWKEGKTAMNPVVHSNNITSNFVMMDFAASLTNPETWRFGAKALADYKSKGPLYREATEAGLFGTEFYSQEIHELLPNLDKMLTADELSANIVTKVANKLYTMGPEQYRDYMGTAYQAEDQFFKLWLYAIRRDSGSSVDDAVDEAEKFFFNYADVPEGVRNMKNFLIPFFSYSYKAAPVLAETMVKHPERYAKWVALFGGINWMAYNWMLGDGEDEDKERALLPEYMKGKTPTFVDKSMRLWENSESGNPMFLDLSRRFPLGDLFDMDNQAGGLPVPAPLMPNHPALNMMFGMLANKDMFTGNEVVRGGMDWSNEVHRAEIAAWVYRQLAPNTPVLPGSYSYNKVMNGIATARGDVQKDVFGNEFTGKDYHGRTQTLPRALMDTVGGFKVREIDLRQESSRKHFALTEKMNALKADRRAVKRDRSMGDGQKDAEIAKINREIKALAQRHREIPAPPGRYAH